MKKISVIALTLILAFGVSTSVVDAHTNESSDMPMMNDSSQTVSQEEFDEVEDIMIKMMNGQELSESEAEEMFSFMQSHHSGGGWPMMVGYGGMHYGAFDGPWHHDGGQFPSMNWLYPLTVLIWLGVGALAIIFLFQKLFN